MREGHAMSIQRPVLTNLTPAADGGGRHVTSWSNKPISLSSLNLKENR